MGDLPFALLRRAPALPPCIVTMVEQLRAFEKQPWSHASPAGPAPAPAGRSGWH